MRVRPTVGLAVAVTLTLPLAVADDAAPPPFVWRADLVQARAQAAEEGRPLLVVFR